MYIGFAVTLIIIGLSNFYICLEGFLLLRAAVRLFFHSLKKGWSILLWLYWPLALLPAFLFFYSRYSSWALRNLFGLASAYWGLFLVIPFFVFAEILGFACFLFRTPRRREGIRRNGKFGFWSRIAALVFALIALSLGSFSARYAKVTGYSISVDKPLPKNGLRLILISDIHIGALTHKKELGRIVSKINALEGDLVLIAGDIIDRDMTVYQNENLNEEFSAIKSSMGVYAVPGNHDSYSGRLGELKEALGAAGVKLLSDEAVLVDNSVYIIGRSDYGRAGTGRKSLDELTGDIDRALPLILMDHQPRNLAEAERAGIDLQVSGHTHNGQIWPGPVLTGRMYENNYGLLYKGKTAAIVTSGCGTWGPPVRIGTRSEIVCIELNGIN
jgi:predicted MPP superfamily phosphohydrolase